MPILKAPLLFTAIACLGLLCPARAQVGVGTNTPDNSAALEVKATDKGLLPPRLTQSERDNINNPAAGLQIWCSTCGSNGEMQVYNGSNWTNMTGGSASTSPTPSVTNPSTGEIWMDRNLGASQVATSYNDANAYGDLYQWGRAADGHEDRNSATYDGDANGLPSSATASGAWDGKFIKTGSSPYDWLSPQNNNLWQGVNGTNNPCPSGYRLPTEAEWEAERQSWSSNDRAGAIGSPLKLPAAGSRQHSDGSLRSVGGTGYYWSSTVSSAFARLLYFFNSNANMSASNRAYGLSVRCLKD